MSAARKYESNYTYQDYIHWEGDWELIGGQPSAMSPAPVKQHQRLVGRLFAEINKTLNECPACEVLIDEDWRIASDMVLRPDVSVVCHDDHPDYIAKAPEIIFEIISPSTARKDEGIKKTIYEEEGVIYYGLVYPDDLVVKLFRINNGKYVKVGDFDKETVAFEDVSCPFALDFAKVIRIKT